MQGQASLGRRLYRAERILNGPVGQAAMARAEAKVVEDIKKLQHDRYVAELRSLLHQGL